MEEREYCPKVTATASFEGWNIGETRKTSERE